MNREAATLGLAPGVSPGYAAPRKASRLQPAAQVLAPAKAGSGLVKTARRHDRGRALTHFFALLMVLLPAVVFAQSITGTVTNGTTGKPAVGDDVTLIALSQGMQEVGSTKTDAQGKFSFPAPADRAPHMV